MLDRVLSRVGVYICVDDDDSDNWSLTFEVVVEDHQFLNIYGKIM